MRRRRKDLQEMASWQATDIDAGMAASRAVIWAGCNSAGLMGNIDHLPGTGVRCNPLTEQGLPAADAFVFRAGEWVDLGGCGACGNLPWLNTEDFQILNVGPQQNNREADHYA